MARCFKQCAAIEGRFMNPVHTLIIACGNPLRGDDAVGSVVAVFVESRQTPGVKVLAVHQLVPELMTCDKEFDISVVEPKQSRRFFGHFETPANLLALLHELYGRAPEARLLAISAYSFGHGDELTQTAQDNLRAAIDWIREFLAAPPCKKLR
jgi:Ni,Fe-hydrogenase maturation factor